MDVDLGVLKPIFVLDTVYGMTTVSLTTLKQRRVKVFYSGLVSVIYVVESTVYIYNNWIVVSTEPLVVQMIKLLNASFIVYTMASAILDSKSKIASALEMQAIEQNLKTANIFCPGSSLVKILAYSSAALNVLFISIQLWNVIMYPSRDMTVKAFFTGFHYFGLLLASCMETAVFLIRALMIRQAVTEWIDWLTHSYSTSSAASERTALRLQVPNESGDPLDVDIITRFNLLKTIEGALNEIDGNMQRCFRVPIVVYILNSVFKFSFAFSMQASYTLTGSIILVTLLSFMVTLTVVWVAERGYQMKEHVGLRLASSLQNCKEESHRSALKRQLLANIHRSSPFSCRIFDVNFGLLSFILENIILVFVAYNANVD